MESIKKGRISELDSLFNTKLTENGDLAHKSTGNRLLDYIFSSEYYNKHLKEVKIGDSRIEKIFSMFIRDPRYGMKYRDLGRVLERQSGVSAEAAAFAGRFDDLWESPLDEEFKNDWVMYLYEQAVNGNELAKKWMPHYVGHMKSGKPAKSTVYASRLRNRINRLTGNNLTKQQYGKLVKVSTVESKLTEKDYDSIDFSKLPSLALIKYWSRFAGTGKNSEKTEMSERFADYLASVVKGEARMNLSTATVYDIYRNASKINPDIAFSQLEKVEGNWLPILDTSGSMFDSVDSIGKACSIAHYLAKTSTYAKDRVLSFSDTPVLIDITSKSVKPVRTSYFRYYGKYISDNNSEYSTEIRRMYTGDCASSTNFEATMKILSKLKIEFPKFLVVLSDMEFNSGGCKSAHNLISEWRSKGIDTRIVWWNFNPRNTTSPQAVNCDADGNVFISGYDPTMLKFLECSFDAESFVDKLLNEYSKHIPESVNI